MKLSNKLLKTMVLPALKPMFGKFAKGILEKMDKLGGNVALIDIENNKVVVGISETGEIKLEAEAAEFKDIGEKFMQSAGSLVEGAISADQAQKFIKSMQIEIHDKDGENFALLLVSSEILGNFDFKYELDGLRKTN